MKIYLIFLFSIPFLLAAQTQDNIFFCGYGNNTMEHKLCNHFKTNFKSNIDAQNAVKKILSPLGLPSNFILVPCDSISNAVAVTPKDGLRYILYDPIFLDKIKRATSDWSSLSILAHEIGHHLAGHTTSGAETLADQRAMELEADEFSGFVMAKLGATLYDSQKAINTYSSNNDDTWSTHPNKTKRLAAIENGFRKSNLDGNSQQNDDDLISPGNRGGYIIEVTNPHNLEKVTSIRDGYYCISNFGIMPDGSVFESFGNNTYVPLTKLSISKSGGKIELFNERKFDDIIFGKRLTNVFKTNKDYTSVKSYIAGYESTNSDSAINFMLKMNATTDQINTNVYAYFKPFIVEGRVAFTMITFSQYEYGNEAYRGVFDTFIYTAYQK